MAAARELVIADEPAAWAALGFAPGAGGVVVLGGVVVRLVGAAGGGGIVALRVEGVTAERPDGLPVVGAAAAERTDGLPVVGADASPRNAAGSSGAVDAAPSRATHPERGGGAPSSSHANGALAIDHVVAFTDDRDRTTAALAAAGGDVRRRGEPPELPAPMAFVRFGELIVEVAQTGGPARFWGVTVTVPDVDALAGPLLGSPRPAVQPGRRIVTVARAAGLSVALAFITPR